MDLSVLSTNLLRVRTAKRKSQTEVADAAGLSRVGYRNIETGTAAPRVGSLMRIAEALDIRVEELLTPVRVLNAVRFRAQKKMTTRGELLASVAGWLDDYNGLEKLLKQTRPFAFASVRAKINRLPKNDRAKKAAALARAAIGIGEGESIRDICGLLEDHGVKVFTPKVASEGFFGLSVAEEDGGPAIIVNVWERLSVERWIFTAAHELGHLLLHLDAYDVTKTDEIPAQEKEADLFASHFLMPEDVFDRHLHEAMGLPFTKVVFKLKRIFRVSWKSVLYRIASKSADGGKLWGRFQGEYRALTGKTVGGTEEPEGLEPDNFRSVRPSAKAADEPEHLVEDDFVEDRLYRLVRAAIDGGHISMGRGAEILDLNLGTMRELANSWVK